MVSLLCFLLMSQWPNPFNQSAVGVDGIVGELFQVARCMPDFVSECLAVIDQILLQYLVAFEMGITV